jgi:periplasmic protein TonB
MVFLWAMVYGPWSIVHRPGSPTKIMQNVLWNLSKIFSPFSFVDFLFAPNHNNKPVIMEKSSILSADILDILFDGRNKTYGAYELRKTYDKRIVYALSGTFFLCLIFMIGSILANGKKKNLQAELATTVVLENFENEKPKPEIPKELPKEQPKIETAKVNIPKIVPDDQVKDDDIVKPVDELEDVKIGNANIAGEKGDDIVAPPAEGETGVVKAPKVEKDIDIPFTTVQIQARFPDGVDGWRKYLERNLNKDLPSENGAPAADYTVTVSFIVDRKGAISDVRAENDPGYGTAAEAIRVIRKGPDWVPAEQNGNKVIYRQKQNITFRVSAD